MSTPIKYPTPWRCDTQGIAWSRDYGTLSAEVTSNKMPFQPVRFTAWIANGGPDGTESQAEHFTGRGALFKAKAAADKMARAILEASQ